MLDGAAAGVPSRSVGKTEILDSEGNALGYLCQRALAPVVGAPWGKCSKIASKVARPRASEDNSDRVGAVDIGALPSQLPPMAAVLIGGGGRRHEAAQSATLGRSLAADGCV